MAVAQQIFHEDALKKYNEEVDFDDEKCKGKMDDLYFDVHGSPCGEFGPVLMNLYQNYSKENVIGTIDETEEEFSSFYQDKIHSSPKCILS